MREHILTVFYMCKHNKTVAARTLGINVKTLYNNLSKYEKEGVDIYGYLPPVTVDVDQSVPLDYAGEPVPNPVDAAELSDLQDQVNTLSNQVSSLVILYGELKRMFTSMEYALRVEEPHVSTIKEIMSGGTVPAMKEQQEEIETELIKQAIIKTGGPGLAAKELGMTYRQLRWKIKKYGLNWRKWLKEHRQNKDSYLQSMLGDEGITEGR
jgi:DNA-binding NtrC family response regulator